MDTDGPKDHGLKDQVNPELMTTLASFLKGHQESTTTSERSKHTKDAVGGEVCGCICFYCRRLANNKANMTLTWTSPFAATSFDPNT